MAVVSSGKQDRPMEDPKEIRVNAVAAYLNDLSTEIGESSDGHGFREDWKLADELEQIAEREIDISTVERETLREAANALRINIVGMKLMLTVSELAEGLETLRDHGMGIINDRNGNFGEELADAKIRIDDMAHMLRIPIGDRQIAKVDANVDRPYKHGRKV